MNRTVRSVGKHIAAFLIVIVSAGIFYAVFKTQVIDLATYYFPCRWPIVYSVGTFDERFGISKDDFTAILTQAEKQWEQAIGKELFKFAEENGMPVHLVYDERQAASQESRELAAHIDTGRAEYDTARKAYDALRREYDALSNQYDASLTEFKARSEAYERDVRAANRRGGATKSEFERLEAERQFLLTLQQALESKRQSVNALAEKLNAQVALVNSYAQNVNEYVREYNSGDFVGREFEEGLFVRDADGSRIMIYEFSSRDELLRVLTHEFGHALGLPHNENPDSIMYELNESKNLTLTEEDRAALRLRCSVSS